MVHLQGRNLAKMAETLVKKEFLLKHRCKKKIHKVEAGMNIGSMQKCNQEDQGPSGVKSIKHNKQALSKYINNKTNTGENVDLVENTMGTLETEVAEKAKILNTCASNFTAKAMTREPGRMSTARKTFPSSELPVRFLDPYMTFQKSHHVPLSIVFLSSVRLGAVTFSLGSLFHCPKTF